ncbi:glycosyl transferase [Parabacteroides distasonis]|uniref:ATP-grasp fold amidoligase family protein n=1 Tax=Parabacteroides distasonis TaxID=823 RepID=UPI00216375D4|nr:ATP-grasp fold amidoligase family protein [Parabacteroides distasonis]MCS2331116.1 glycosyl transferase [Parabacteroides distasonis]MCS3226400.1 glycosyl transferase [Parabacteroides distasonis]MCS3345661.1 glycosyl transferase [Parabacteroides distasonis]UVQ80172.1 glycosyl transferase [Parabacteroides distasonis]
MKKICWLALYWQKPIVVKCADKYELREYVSSLGLMELMPQLYGVYTDVKGIEWNRFPKKFVIKCTHGCKYNIVCFNKDELDIHSADISLNKWLHSVYGTNTYEPHYSKMTPRIIAEEFIETSERGLPEDYKVYCFNGEPKCVLVCLNRESELVLEWYDLEWNVFDIGAKSNMRRANKPACLDQMIKYARILSKGFPFVRVDFYDSFGKPILGEMTFTPMYGMAKYYSKEGNLLLGSMLTLPNKYKGHFE